MVVPAGDGASARRGGIPALRGVRRVRSPTAHARHGRNGVVRLARLVRQRGGSLMQRMHRIVWIGVVAAVLAAGVAAAKGLGYRKTVLVRIPTEFTVKGAPDVVWQKLTNDRTFMTLAGFTSSSMMPAHQWEKIGDATPAMIGQDGGVLVVTKIDPSDRELRVAFEPGDGAYLCHHTVKLAPDAASGGTRITLVSRYTDDKTPATVDKTARETAAAQMKSVAAFKASVDQ